MLSKHIIANYHYIEDRNTKEWGGIWPCGIAEFERQVKFLSENYKFASIGEIFDAAKKGSKEMLCTITFDDGLKDQYINAVPILEKYCATAIFFPITSTFEGNVPGTHKLHILLSKSSAEFLIDIFNREFPLDQIPKDRRINETRRLFEDMLTANLKEKLLSSTNAVKDKFLNSAFDSAKLNEKEYNKRLFMSKEEIKDLYSSGFAIGSHTHGHYALNSLSKENGEKEIKTSKEMLTRLLGVAPEIISYPHGRLSSEIKDILKAESFKYGFSIESRELGENEDPYLIPRLDTNDIKKLTQEA